MRIVPTQIAQAVLELEKTGQYTPEVLARGVRALLTRKHLLRYSSKVMAALTALEARARGECVVTATSAHVLDPASAKLVRQVASQFFESEGNRVEVHFEQDPQLLGGVRLATSDKQYDFSLARTLQEFRRQF